MATVQKRVEFLVNFGGKTHVLSESDALQIAIDIVEEFMRDKEEGESDHHCITQMQERLDDLEYIHTGMVKSEQPPGA